MLYGLLTIALAGCGGDRSRATQGDVLGACSPGTVAVGSSARALGAAAARDLAVYDRPGGRPSERFRRLNPNGVPTVFGVVAKRVDERCAATWYRVRLPRRPNHRTAWVRARDVEVAEVRTRILVDLSARRVTLYRDGRKVMSTTFGPGAIGIAAYSEVLTGWAQGGPIAIHGTNRPDLIGEAVSNGCVRIRNDVLRRMFASTLAGTPVVIER